MRMRGRARHVPWAIALVCVVLGFMLSMQFKVQKQVALKDISTFQRAQDLAQQLEQAEKARNDLGAEVDQLRATLRNQVSTADVAEQLELAQLHAGLIPMVGPGVVVTMDDSHRPVQPGENPMNLILHDEDVLLTVNELAASGAEAISINGQRLIARSEIRCTGPTITINGVRTAPPLVITAIGNSDLLESTITMRNGIAEQLQDWGIQVTVKKESSVTVPAYKGSLKLQYGQPDTSGGTKP